jgi:hypothetical protein
MARHSGFLSLNGRWAESVKERCVFAMPAVYYVIYRNSQQLPSCLECRKLDNNLDFRTFM